MSVRDMYITMLEKRASEHDVLGVDSQAVANDDHGANLQDQRAELTNLFNQAESVGKADTKLLNKSLPIAKKTEGTSASSTMVKAAMNSAFFEALRETGHLKVATPEYLRAAYGGFQDELEKIGLAPLALAGLASAGSSLLGGVKKLFKGATGDEEKTAKMMPGEVMKHLAAMPKRVAKKTVTLKPTGQKSTFRLVAQ